MESNSMAKCRPESLPEKIVQQWVNRVTGIDVHSVDGRPTTTESSQPGFHEIQDVNLFLIHGM
jgi:hypothetical protein